ncbi:MULTISPECIES: hypothetical protein [Bradyrhizobium]|uniref:hypothetical protein n=1 Tax=Bradyrhizobium elkanii TaxID=29448 RepID=UPI0027149A63|nr:hypothetical protein [Bradyrhizobium elkanii]WLA51993.1 hypothetical protein QIH80_18870 [Bradyrhizobium elkanii]WLB77686.1 hypothetical protein QIH83_25305 [Bradyrhizobium elkanii]
MTQLTKSEPLSANRRDKPYPIPDARGSQLPCRRSTQQSYLIDASLSTAAIDFLSRRCISLDRSGARFEDH